MALYLVATTPDPDKPTPTTVQVYISESGRNADGRITVGYKCASFRELEGVVEMLKDDLDSILRKGRNAFNEAETR